MRKYSGSGSKLRCPRCGRKSFTPYIDTQTNEILDENVGICDHKNSCGYHFSPREYFARTRVNCQCGSHPHKKKEFFVRTRTGNSPVGNAGFSAKNNATNTSIKHYSTSLKHHQNTPNNQHISVQPHRQLWHSRADLQIKKDNRYALFASAARTPARGAQKKPCVRSTKETLCAERKETLCAEHKETLCAERKENYTIPKEIIKNMENGFNFTSHNLEMYMIEHFGRGAYDDIQKMFQRMIVKGDFEGGTLFYQIDLNGDIRTAKIIRYDAHTGHRIKSMGANWLHSVIIKGLKNQTIRLSDNERAESFGTENRRETKRAAMPYLQVRLAQAMPYLKDFTLKQVPFGLWQLKMRKDKVFNMAEPLQGYNFNAADITNLSNGGGLPICIYEAEKTACFMDFVSHDRGVHLALGGYDYLKTDMLLPLVEAGVKRACLFPDKGCFSGWTDKANKVMSELPIELVVSDVLENTTLPDGSDFADMI